jgi:c-di-GMP-related signal transduction protein
VFERFITRQAILKDNLTLFGYDLRFRAEEFGVGEVIGGKPAKLIRAALARAYFCEELARPLGLSRNSSELFLMGLLSTADALLDAQCRKSWPSYRYPSKFALH